MLCLDLLLINEVRVVVIAIKLPGIPFSSVGARVLMESSNHKKLLLAVWLNSRAGRSFFWVVGQADETGKKSNAS
jgi:hypothetical protein